MELWYERPAGSWNEALPVGNGRLGAMVKGDPLHETIWLNEDSIWSGRPVDRVNRDARENIPEIRRLIREGRIEEAEKLALLALSGTPNSARNYEPAGELRMEFDLPGKVGDYRRSLDLKTGICETSFSAGGEKYVRKVFASFPSQVLVVSIESEGPRGICMTCRFDRCHNRTDEVMAEGDTIGFDVRRPEGISFAVRLKAKITGGSMTTIGEHLVIKGAEKVFFFLDAETSFRHEDYEKVCLDNIEKASDAGFDCVYDEHVSDLAKNLNTLELELCGADEDRTDLSTEERLRRLKEGMHDPGLFALYFQYGRYLLFSSSRGCSLPANLQGIWNDSLTPPWDSKFTININMEMNYWIADCCNLSLCYEPFFAFLKRLCENGKKTAERMYGCRGSVAHHNTDIYADTAPQDMYIPASFWVMGEAWLATHIIDHYLYTLDKDFLKEHFYILKECVEFFDDYLIDDGEGHLVISPSVSPENTYILPNGSRGCLCEGPAMDTEILTELLTGFIYAAGVLECDDAYVGIAEKMLSSLPKIQTGSCGQILEWLHEYEEAEPGHRHISHLYGVFPGSSISYEKTPELMEAAKVTLNRRLAAGGGHTGWSRAWIIALRAHFLEGEEVYENLRRLLSDSTFINLMDNHPMFNGYVFQIDGNMGAVAGMTDMLVQCRDGYVRLLPALPSEFANGKVSGIRLRGGFILSMEWAGGKVVSYRIERAAGAFAPAAPVKLTVNLNGTTEDITV